uniref:Uncharacterized protein n=1 Tax=viral metagenome TaxID=1070528 RepID=A0A6C0EXZ5_9ZZZZ
MSKLSITPIDPKHETGPMGYCPYMDIHSTSGSYSTLTEGLVAPEKRSMNENTAIPDPLPNGGLFGGPQSTGPWANIPVIPSDTNLIHYNLRSANPPPGATEQYIGTDRLGNNYAPMIGVYWYNPEGSNGMFRMAVTKKEDAKQY